MSEKNEHSPFFKEKNKKHLSIRTGHNSISTETNSLDTSPEESWNFSDPDRSYEKLLERIYGTLKLMNPNLNGKKKNYQA